MKHNKKSINTNRPLKIVVKLLRCKEKTKIIQNGNKLKGQNIFINSDFSKATFEMRKDVLVEVKKAKGTR